MASGLRDDARAVGCNRRDGAELLENDLVERVPNRATRGRAVSPLTFVSWRWLSPVGYRSVFAPDTVYALRDMIARYYQHPHRFVCVTDEPKLLPGIETIQMWEDGAAIPSPSGRHNPSCYRRLKVFAPDAGKLFG